MYAFYACIFVCMHTYVSVGVSTYVCVIAHVREGREGGEGSEAQ